MLQITNINIYTRNFETTLEKSKNYLDLFLYIDSPVIGYEAYKKYIYVYSLKTISLRKTYLDNIKFVENTLLQIKLTVIEENCYNYNLSYDN